LNKDEIKLYLRDNPEYIENVLESLGCHHIKIIPNKRVQSAREDGDNPTSVQVKLNDTLSSVIHTKNDFNKYEYKDIYTLVQYMKDCDFTEAIAHICKVCDIEYDKNIKKQTYSNSYQFLKQFKRSINKENILENYENEAETLDESFKYRFIRDTCKLFYDDGIYKDTQDKFWVSYDVLDNRVVFPIRNDDGKILTFKGRTCDKDWKIKGIAKYLSYYPYHAECYLFGLYENYFDILSANEIIVGEAEKFVMQLDSMGINNALGLSKKIISPYQLNKLLKLGKDIVLAFDKGVSLEDIYIECRKFKGLCNVYYIYDCDNLLKDKESPSDKGYEIFNKLYTEYKFKYKGE